MLPEKQWDPEALARYGLSLMTSLFGGLLLITASAPLLKGWDKEDIQIVHFLIFTLSFQGAMIALAWYFLREQAISWNESFGFKNGRPGIVLMTTVFTSLGIVIGGTILGAVSGTIMQWIGMTPETQEVVQTLQKTDAIWRLFIYGFVTIIVAPVAEEILFRGILFAALKRIGFPRAALWGTSVLFAAIHFNLMAAIPLFFVAVMLALLYEETGNLLAPIGAHALFNTMNFLFLIFEEPLTRFIETMARQFS